MSKIENVQLPHNQRGNDPADYIGEPGYLGNLKVIELDEKPTQIQPDTEDDLGLIFSKKYRERLRYVAQMGRWFLWDGRTWVQDQILEVFDLVRRLCRECFTEESGLRKKMLNAGTIAAIERLVRSDKAHRATVDQWDADDLLLNTPNGIVDLITGELKPHDPDQHCTKITTVGPGDSSPAFLRFLNEVTNYDQDLIDFIQRVLGYSCTGITKEHALFFFYGTGGNGKGTLLNAVTSILSNYAKIASMDVFTESKHERHSTELAGLMGARLVVAQEVDEGRRWNESRIKALTGGDPITARFMRQDEFTFVPKFTLIIAGNHKPSLQTVDEAMRRRLHLIPFDVIIPKDKRDPDLPEKLQAESSGIMQWLIDGAVSYHEQGLNPPESVRQATESYFQDENTLEQWITDCCETGPEYWETPTILFNSWKLYALAANLIPCSNKVFKSKLEAIRIQQTKTGKHGRRYQGIRIKTQINEDYEGEYSQR